MRIVRTLPYRFWKHKHSSRRASIFGACPWTGAEGDTENDWELTTKGWTWEVIDSRGNSTYGLSRVPAETEDEALKVMKTFNAKFA